MPLTIVRQDITKMRADAVVNAANTSLAMGGGVCGAIFRAAGAEDLQAACDRLAPIRTGEAVITPAFALPSRYIIHAAGPVYSQYSADESERLLRSAYLSSLRLADDYGCESVAFPLISSGIYGYPKESALRVATSAIRDYLAEHDLDVYLAVFDLAAFEVSEKLLGEVESYIDEHYVKSHADAVQFSFRLEREAEPEYPVCGNYADAETHIKPSAPAPPIASSAPDMSAAASGIDELIGNLDEPFGTALLRLIDAKGRTDVEVYKRANLDRKLFSKIRTVKGYTPSKRTVLALAVALELTPSETDELLSRAGYALSHSQKFDVIVEYFIVSGNYDIFEINEVLFKYDQPLLGG